jgi:hypothetical protein
MIKFGFKIRTRGGMVVDNLQIGANDRAEAERKVGQIYQRCEILECAELRASVNRSGGLKDEEGLDLEGAIDLIDAEGPREAAPQARKKASR